ncbi:MAG: hypothetical protein WKG01_08120 [Kofleriaceae bacterium]
MHLARLVVPLMLVACGPSGRASVDAGDVGDDGATSDAGPCEDVVDVVFVLDTSSSMDFVLSKLEAQIPQVVTATNAVAADAHFGLIVFQDNHLLDVTGPLEAGKVHTSADSLRSAFRYYRETFTAFDRNPGDGPSGLDTQNPICEENSLDALHAAAVDFPWRSNATRVIILATDDTFLERSDNYGDRDGDGDTSSTTYPREGDYPAAFTLTETAGALKAARTRVFSFSRIRQPSIGSRCSTGRRMPWGDITDGWTTPYLGQVPIPMQTDGANYDLDKVKAGTLLLAETINQVVLDSYCVPPVL